MRALVSFEGQDCVPLHCVSLRTVSGPISFLTDSTLFGNVAGGVLVFSFVLRCKDREPRVCVCLEYV